MRTRSKHLVLIMAICLVFIFSALAHAFTDIDAHWARETIEQSYEKGIVSGMPDGTFQPNKNVTRAEFATMINKAFGFNDAVTEIKFNDVKDSDWFAREVAIAVKAGYIKGYPDGTFKPQNLCTRAEASVMIRLAAGLPEGKEDALRDFKDEASIPEFARGSISALVAQGLIKGYPDGTFGPQNKITRAESLVMIYKTSIADDDDDEVKRVAVTGVELNKTSITIDEGNSYQLQATVKPADATNKKVEWTSEDEKIATVDSTGLVKGIKAGNTTITVTTEDGGFTATCSVNVTVKTPGGGGGGGGGGIVPVTGVEVEPAAKTLIVGDTFLLKATVKPSNASNKSVTWVSENESVATVDENGLVTAIAEGTANVTVKTMSGNKTAVCVVTVSSEIYSITFEKGVAPIGQTTMYVKLVGVDNHSDYKVFYDGVEMTYSEPRDAFRMFVPETLTEEEAKAKLTYQEPEPPGTISYAITFEKGVAPIGQTTMYVKLVGVDNHSDYKVFYDGVEMTYSEPRDAFRMFVPETLTEEEAKAKLTYQEPEPPGTISYAITFEKGVAPIGQTTMYVKLVGVDNHSDYKVFYDGVEMTYSEPRDAFRMFVPETTTKESAVGKLTNVKI